MSLRALQQAFATEMVRRRLIPRSWPGRKDRQGEAGIAIGTSILVAVVIIIGSLLLTARSLSTWLRSAGHSDRRAATDAAEYGFTKLLSQLNTDAKAYLLVTKYDKDNPNSNYWQNISQTDLNACGVYASTTPSSNPIAGVATNSSNKSVTLPNSPSQSYSLTNYTPPEQPIGASNLSPCNNSTSAAKFGNLLGGSATLEVTGSVTRNGRVAASYVLRRTVHVKWPNQAISNPIVLLGTGSQLNTLNGRICQTSANPIPTTCTNLPLTTIACADLEDCLYYNVDLVSGKNRKNYCNSAYNPQKKYKKNIICNEYQQLGSLPAFPTLASFGDTRPTSYTSATPTISVDFNCGDDIKKCSTTQYYYNSTNQLTERLKSDGKSLTVEEDYSYFPYDTTSLNSATSKATLPTTLLPGCYYNSTISPIPQTSTVINCVFETFATNKADLKVNLTNIMPVNIWIIDTDTTTVSKKKTTTTPAIDIGNGGGIYNSDSSSTGWQNLRIFGYNNPSNPTDFTTTTNNCTAQTVLLDKAKGRSSGGIIDGAFLWFPNATFQYNALNTAGPYLAMWVCKLTGPTKGTDVIVTPLSRRGINAGISNSLNGFGGSIGLDIYRAFGAKGTASDDN